MISASSKPIICCGFTPCIQRIIEFKKFEKGRVNRVLRLTNSVGGKGANTARMVTQLGGTSMLVGFLGGANGERVKKILAHEEVVFQHVEVTGETRICQTLIEENNPEPTELVEEMPPISIQDWDRMMMLLNSLEFSDRMVSVSGKLSIGAPIDAYAQISKMVARQGGRVMLDTPGESLLLALKHNPFLVKINDVELRHTMGSDNLIEASQELIQRGAQSVLITRGGRSAFYIDKFETLRIYPPKIKAINPVGSGDAVMAGLAVELNQGRSIHEAIIRGMICGAANALTLISGLLELNDVDRLRGQVTIHKV